MHPVSQKVGQGGECVDATAYPLLLMDGVTHHPHPPPRVVQHATVDYTEGVSVVWGDEGTSVDFLRGVRGLDLVTVVRDKVVDVQDLFGKRV